jgi:hypothetical protein
MGSEKAMKMVENQLTNQLVVNSKDSEMQIIRPVITVAGENALHLS